MSEVYWYVIEGINPIPWTSPNVSVGRRKGSGQPFPIVYAAEELKTYKTAVEEAIRENYPDAPFIEDEIALRFYFWRNLPSVERGKRKSRSAVADATNLQKSTEDALQGVLFKNDQQVVHAESWVMEQSDEAPSRIVIRLEWHPDRPDLPDDVTEQFTDADTAPEPDDNEHDVPVDDWF